MCDRPFKNLSYGWQRRQEIVGGAWCGKPFKQALQENTKQFKGDAVVMGG